MTREPRVLPTLKPTESTDTRLTCVPRITVRQLNRRGACLDQVTRFRMRFGSQAIVTVELCSSVCHDFDFEWAAAELLHKEHEAEVEDAIEARMDKEVYANYDLVLAEEFARKYMEVYPNVP